MASTLQSVCGLMAVVGFVMHPRFVEWVCDCGAAFSYRSGTFPQQAVNAHFDNECLSLHKRMAGGGHYYRGLRFVIAPPASVLIGRGADPGSEIGLETDGREWAERIPSDLVTYWNDR